MSGPKKRRHHKKKPRAINHDGGSLKRRGASGVNPFVSVYFTCLFLTCSLLPTSVIASDTMTFALHNITSGALQVVCHQRGFAGCKELFNALLDLPGVTLFNLTNAFFNTSSHETVCRRYITGDPLIETTRLGDESVENSILKEGAAHFMREFCNIVNVGDIAIGTTASIFILGIAVVLGVAICFGDRVRRNAQKKPTETSPLKSQP